MKNNPAPFKQGDRVKWSGYVIQHKRNYWLNCGREPMKSGAREALDKATAQRGTVQECAPGQYAPWVVQWVIDGETTPHFSLPHLVEAAT